MGRFINPFTTFISTESSSGILLIACAVLALLWANSPWSSTYDSFFHQYLGFESGIVSLKMSLQHWINDGLMVVFFFLVGLEIKREMLTGELASLRSAALPIFAALGGMVVPALLYLAVNGGQSGHSGWGIPMATDIAFSLAVLALIGSRVPLSLKIFLTALAIVDDLGAVVVIALFYTAEISTLYLALAFAVLALAAAGNKFGVKQSLFYIVIGICAWYFLLNSGVHATIAGVLLAFTIPSDTLLPKFEHAIHKPVAFVIMPLFAIANAGVSFIGGMESVEGGMRVATGVMIGLMLGKSVGITLFSYAAVRLGLASLPNAVTWKSIYGVAWIAGIGFTMSLFVGGLAFGAGPLLDWAKIGIFVASLVSGLAGYFILKQLYK